MTKMNILYVPSSSSISFFIDAVMEYEGAEGSLMEVEMSERKVVVRMRWWLCEWDGAVGGGVNGIVVM